MQSTFWWLTDERFGMDEKGEGIQKCKFLVTEESWGCKLKNREKLIILQ